MRLDDLLADVESEPDAVARVGVVALPVAIEQVANLLSLDPWSSIFDRELDARSCDHRSHGDHPTGRRELQRVADQVCEDLKYALFVGTHDKLSAGGVGAQLDSCRRRTLGEQLDRGLQQRCCVAFLEGQMQISGVDAS